MKQNNTRYRNISNLKDIECEKQLIHYRLDRKEKKIHSDWNSIRDAWSVVAIAGRVIANITEYIPVGISIVSFVKDLFRKKAKQD